MSAPDSDRRRLAVIVNPTKFADLESVIEQMNRICEDEGWAAPLVLETTIEDPGVGQSEQAVGEGVDVVCALGGDGTVRSVATSLVGTDTPLGLLPGGTGNLLARNLGLPVDSLESALRTVLGGTDRRIDVGLVRLFPDSPSAGTLKGDDTDPTDARREDEEVFLIMTGIGVDAEVMANTSEKVKGVIGWPAYVFAGLTRLFRRGFRVRLDVSGPDSSSGSTSGLGSPPKEQHARSVIVGNCGTLQGNLQLLPDARLDDGILDAVVLAPNGVTGWLSVILDLATRQRRGHRRMVRTTGTSITVITRDPVETQIDGDPKGAKRGLSTRVLPSALTVRVRAERSGSSAGSR